MKSGTRTSFKTRPQIEEVAICVPYDMKVMKDTVKYNCLLDIYRILLLFTLTQNVRIGFLNILIFLGYVESYAAVRYR